MRRVIGLLSVFLLLGLAPELQAGEKWRVTDKAKVYYGNHKNFNQPAIITLDTVLKEIPEYQEAQESTGAKREILLAKASKKANQAIKKTAKAEKKDLVAELGFVKGENNRTPNDITKQVIKNLGS